MSKERISSNVPRQTKIRVKKAAEALGISESKFIEQAVMSDLDKLDIREETQVAYRQRDHFKAKYDDTLTDYNSAISKIKALQERGLFARIFNRPPKV